MTLEQMLDHFRRRGAKVVRQGAGWRTRCLAHAGEDNNLELKDREGGGVEAHCWSHDCELELIASAAGLKPADFFPPPAKHANGEGLGHEESSYPYRDEENRVLYFVGRFSGKEFRQWREDARGGRIWGLGNVRRVLFGLPELLATKAGELVAIVEGEKDAISVASQGIAATTNPMGAGKWRQEHTDWLKDRLPDRRFVILPDNDEPGHRHAIEVYESLKRAGLDVAVLMLPDLAPKGDVSDWLRAGGTGEKLRELAKPPRHPLFTGIVSGSELQRLKLPKPEPLVPNLVFRGFSSLLAGDSKLGKSSLLLRMMWAMACGGWWLDPDRRPENRLPECRVLYLNFEDPLSLTQDRSIRMMAPDDLSDNFLSREPPYGFSLAEIITWLPEAKRELSLDAVVLDPIAIAAEWKDENDNAEVALTFKALQRAASETQLAILSAHHVTKKPGQRGLNIRGGSAIKANVLGYLMLEEEKGRLRLSGINKLTGAWDVYLGRREHDYSWWIEETREGHTRSPQQAVKDQTKADLYGIVREAPGQTTEALANTLDLPGRTCRRYLAEMEEVGTLFSLPLPRSEGQRGGERTGWFCYGEGEPE